MRHAARLLIGATISAAVVTHAAGLAQPRQRLGTLPAGTSAIRGTLIDAVTKAPVASCTVRASLLPATPTVMRAAIVTTGADGAYEFSGISDGNYYLWIECPSYLRACVESVASSGPPCGNVTVFKDQQLSNLDFKLTPAATVRGRVVDSNGRPVAKAAVRMGGPFLGNSVMFAQASTTKDDGTFEIGGLAAGAWAFEVEAPPAPGAYRSPLVYYPGVLKRDEAGLVEVVTGEVKDGVTVTIPPVLDRTLTVRIPPPDATVTDVNVSLIRAEPLMTRRLELDAEGQAAMKGLIDGRYVVMATGVSGQQRWVDFMAFDFLEESLEVPLQLRPSGSIRGRVVADRGGLPPLDGASIGAAWVDNDVTLNPLSVDEAIVSMDGSFEIDGVFGRRKLQLVRFDPGWMIYSVQQGRSDVTEAGVEVAPGNTTDVTIVVRRRQ
jgi:hypothetical protein